MFIINQLKNPRFWRLRRFMLSFLIVGMCSLTCMAEDPTFFNPGSLDVALSNCGGGTYSARFYWSNPATSGWAIHLAETGGFWPIESHAIAYGTTERWVTLTAGRQYCFRLQYNASGAAVYGYCFSDADCGPPPPTGPTNLRLEQVPSTCQNSPYTVKFEWDGQGSGWWLDVDTDPCFDGSNTNCSPIGSWDNYNVSNLSNLMSNNVTTLNPGQTYYWRMWDGSTHIYPNSGHTSWSVATCSVTPPTNLGVSWSGCSANNYSATFTWTNGAGANWQLQLAETGGFYPVVPHNISGGATSITINNLNKWRDYCWRIQYGQNAGDAAYGPGCFNETNACPPAVTPTNLYTDFNGVPCADAGTAFQTTFKWSGAAVAGWTIQYGNGNYSQSTGIGVGTVQKTISGFNPDINYQWRIKYGSNYTGANYFSLPTCSTQTDCYPVYGIHWWQQGANADIMNGQDGWSVEIIYIEGVNNDGDLNGHRQKLKDIIDDGFTPIVRLCWGVHRTVPREGFTSTTKYADHVERTIRGLYTMGGHYFHKIKFFQMGNEPNLDYEYPDSNNGTSQDGQAVPVQVYADYFNAAYSRIHPNGGNDLDGANVLIGPPANWAPTNPITGQMGYAHPSHYYDNYYKEILDRVTMCDGYAIHTYGSHINGNVSYTNPSNGNGIQSINWGEDGNLYHSYPSNILPNTRGFNSFKVLMHLIDQYGPGPANAPVFITETNTSAHLAVKKPNNQPFNCNQAETCPPNSDCLLAPPSITYPEDYNWMDQSYGKIDAWNNNGNNQHKIRALCWFVYDSQSSDWVQFELKDKQCRMNKGYNEFKNMTATKSYNACTNITNTACQANHNVNNVAQNTHYQASNTVTATGEIQNNSHVIYNGGNSVVFTSGFNTGGGSFHAMNQGCSGNPTRINQAAATPEKEGEHPFDKVQQDQPLKAFPNPFDHRVQLTYELEEAQTVTLGIYNLLGQQVVVLLDGAQDPGTIALEWDGTDQRGQQMAAGTYFCRLVVGELQHTTKLMLMR